MKNETCKDRINESFKSTMTDIKTLYEAENNETEELGQLNEYGLCMDYVKSGTFNGQKTGYKRYQISWGGPSTEFRIYDNDEVEYWFLDWFDGAHIEVTGDDADIIKELTSWIQKE